MSNAETVSKCELCPATFSQRMGRPRRYCGDCEAIGKALRALEIALTARPQALPAVIEAIENVDVPRGLWSDEAARKLRASAFTLASRGRQLKPGSSGRYTRKPGVLAPAAPAGDEDLGELFRAK